jgi:hypothetical protein
MHDPVDRSGRFGPVLDWWAVGICDELATQGLLHSLARKQTMTDLLRSLALDLRNCGLDDENAVRVAAFVMHRWGSGVDSDVDPTTARLARECLAKHVRPAMPDEVAAGEAVSEGTRSHAPAPALRAVLPSVAGPGGSWVARTRKHKT